MQREEIVGGRNERKRIETEGNEDEWIGGKCMRRNIVEKI